MRCFPGARFPSPLVASPFFAINQLFSPFCGYPACIPIRYPCSLCNNTLAFSVLFLPVFPSSTLALLVTSSSAPSQQPVCVSSKYPLLAVRPATPRLVTSLLVFPSSIFPLNSYSPPTDHRKAGNCGCLRQLHFRSVLLLFLVRLHSFPLFRKRSPPDGGGLAPGLEPLPLPHFLLSYFGCHLSCPC